MIALLQALVATALLAAGTAAAATPIDDRGSYALAPLAIDFPRGVPGRRGNARLEGTLDAVIRLNTAPLVGRVGRIVLVLPAELRPIELVSWSAQAPWSAGSARPGDRIAVWSGRITQPTIETALRFVVTARPDQPLPPQFTFNFEFVE